MPREREQHAVRHGRYHASDPVRCGTRIYEKDASEPGLTPQFALVYLSKGKGRYRVEGGSWQPLAVGDAFQRFPDQPHFLEVQAGTVSNYLAVPREVLAMMRSLGFPTADRTVIRIGTRHRFLRRHAEMTATLRDAPPHRLMQAVTSIQALMVEMHLHAMRQAGSQGMPDWVEQACLILSSDLDRRMDMPSVARELGIGYSLFRKTFKQALGMAPNDYRVRRRIERAQEMILQGRPAVEIAGRLGYQDLFAFSSQFKKIVGLAPRHYQRAHG
jgi:AraC-like DNA-binding protein